MAVVRGIPGSVPALHRGAVQLALPSLCWVGAEAPGSSGGAVLGSAFPGGFQVLQSDLSVLFVSENNPGHVFSP